MTVSIDKIMKIENILLQIEDKYKFKLEFNDLLKLKELISEIGKITELFFNIQIEFGEKYKDIELLKNYKEKLLNAKINFNVKKYIAFIDNIDKKLNCIVSN
jgi:hypothetical protein